jgi:low temperature requirement protein LtrA
MRPRSGGERVTNVELFFDLVYVFAVTQISHYLLAHPTVTGALRAGLLLAMTWLLWVYTTWVTNWLDPQRIAVRLMLLVLAGASLVMSAALPGAFSARGLIVGIAYAATQIGRSAFTVVALRGRPLQRNFQRILAWCLVSGALAVLGGLAGGNARAGLWLAAVAVDLLGGAVGFYTPGLGRSTTQEWAIEGGHFAERCQAFMLIALGESIVVIGATLSGLAHITGSEIAAFIVALCGSVGLWWLYFDRSADDAARVIATSDDPGRLGRSAYHFIHPIMIAGIIVGAAADEVTLADPAAVGRAPTSWMILGGVGLFLAGHAAFKAVIWREASWPRIGALVILALLGLAAPQLSALALSTCAAALVIVVAVADYVRQRGSGAGSADGAGADGGAGAADAAGAVSGAGAVGAAGVDDGAGSAGGARSASGAGSADSAGGDDGAGSGDGAGAAGRTVSATARTGTGPPRPGLASARPGPVMASQPISAAG